MSEGTTLVCDLPENERNDLISLFNQCKLTGQIMTMTKEDAERLINDAMSGKKTEPETKKDETVTEAENKQDNKEVKPKPQKTMSGKKTEPETKKDETVTEAENKQDNKEVKPKPQKTIIKEPEPDLPKCPRCYSPVKGRKCSSCGFKF